MTRAFRLRTILGALTALLALTGCSGGGGGGPSGPSPMIVSAAFVGAGPTPAAGEVLLLFLSEDVTLVVGKLITDEDLVLTSGATLGSVSAAPVQVNNRTIQVTLATGVTLVPGTTTIGFSANNDAVRDANGLFGKDGTPVIIGTSDGQAPVISRLTLSNVDPAMNGTGPAGGTLQVPQHTFTIDLAYSDNTAIDTAATLIQANVAVNTTMGSKPADTNLVPFLVPDSVTGTAASYSVPLTAVFPPTSVTLTAVVVDVTGLASAAVTFTFAVRNFSDAVRPFETSVNSSQVWFLDLSRDIEAFTVNLANASTPVEVNAGANGRPDLDDLFLALGLHHLPPIANVSGSLNSNQVVIERFSTALAAELATLLAGANITFTYTQPAGSFGGQTSVAYAALGYSRICIAGAEDPSGATGVLGVAIYDENNATQNDDCRTDFGGSQRLGIFLHTVINDGFKQSGGTLFRMTFDPFTPARGGTAIGDDASDGLRLMGTLNDGRTPLIDTAIDGIARFAAIVLAHECGHSMGLVKNLPMPTGLYGNDTTNFPGSADGHIRNTALFPSGSVNVMSPSLSFSLANHPATAFNTLNLAYLRERVLYNN